MTKDLKIIGKGKISTIYSDGFYAYKTYPVDYNKNWIRYEYDIHQTILSQTQLPMVHYTYEPDSNMIVMDLVKGITLADRMRKLKYPFGLEDFTFLQHQIFQYEIKDLPDAFKVFKNQIDSAQLSDILKHKALESLKQIEYKQLLCHFDFHFENVLFDGSNYVIVDWVNAKAGNPVMDVARSYIILKQYAQRLSMKYLKMICQKTGIDIKEVLKAVPLMAFLRILENDTDPFKATLEQLIMEGTHE